MSFGDQREALIRGVSNEIPYSLAAAIAIPVDGSDKVIDGGSAIAREGIGSICHVNHSS